MRMRRKSQAEETVRIVGRGRYTPPDGTEVHLSAAVRDCLAATRYYPAEEVAHLRRGRPVPEPGRTTMIELSRETTLEGIRRVVGGTAGSVGALNFASAKNPGGGFLNGSQAQEESLARSSALYASQNRAPAFYDRHRASPSCLYTDGVIVSPACPVFRDDDGRLLSRYHTVTFLTCAAPNAGAVAKNQPRDVPKIPGALRDRADGLLAVAASVGLRVLVLGAWGCGVFRNDPEMVGGVFADFLLPGRPWHGHFDRVVFSVYEPSPGRPTVAAFRSALGTTDTPGR